VLAPSVRLGDGRAVDAVAVPDLTVTVAIDIEVGTFRSNLIEDDRDGDRTRVAEPIGDLHPRPVFGGPGIASSSRVIGKGLDPFDRLLGAISMLDDRKQPRRHIEGIVGRKWLPTGGADWAFQVVEDCQRSRPVDPCQNLGNFSKEAARPAGILGYPHSRTADGSTSIALNRKRYLSSSFSLASTLLA